jgi:galactose oxidase
VPIHTHVLPTGKVLFWGRRNPPGTRDFPSLNQRQTHSFIWNPANPLAPAKPTSNQPADSHGNPINLFCSGHTFLEDGRLLVTGGHLFDSQGLNCSTFYDSIADKWTAGPTMNNGRWYPTAVTLPDGRVFVCSGSFPSGPLQPPPNANAINNISQILENESWNDLSDFPEQLPLFPCLHVAPDGSLFMSGLLATSFFFKDFEGSDRGKWVSAATRTAGNSDYAPSVMYEIGKVIFIGGGAPTDIVETIDLSAPKPAWAVGAPMKFRRRQHNATLLPDGTVLVTGGTQGTGFDNLDLQQPVHTPELWDPSNGTWKQMAPEHIDRCYHSTAVLLPDGRVFSGGGGEYAPENGVSNPPINTNANAQLFSPPYLFKGARPIIKKAPPKVAYGEAFEVETPAPNDVSRVSWIRLPSVTHSFDQNQRINFLDFKRGLNQVTVTAPANGNICPPGHYMLFLLNQNKIPSEAAIIQIKVAAAPKDAAAASTEVAATARSSVVLHSKPFPQKSPREKDDAIRAEEKQPPVVVGVTPTCPYGLSACWAGAVEALKHMHGVKVVRPLPNAQDSTAYVYLEHGGLPDLEVWPEQFAAIANGTHLFRGVEVTLENVLITDQTGTLIMHGNDIRPPILLEPIEASDKIQWDVKEGALKPLAPEESDAYVRLQQKVNDAGGSLTATVIGPIKKFDGGYILKVRQFSISKTA